MSTKLTDKEQYLKTWYVNGEATPVSNKSGNTVSFNVPVTSDEATNIKTSISEDQASIVTATGASKIAEQQAVASDLSDKADALK